MIFILAYAVLAFLVIIFGFAHEHLESKEGKDPDAAKWICLGIWWPAAVCVLWAILVLKPIRRWRRT